jgi:hypothetical protein
MVIMRKSKETSVKKYEKFKDGNNLTRKQQCVSMRRRGRAEQDPTL